MADDFNDPAYLERVIDRNAETILKICADGRSADEKLAAVKGLIKHAIVRARQVDAHMAAK